MNTPLENTSRELVDGIFDERWVNFSRIQSGIFILDGELLSPERYRSDCYRLRQILLSSQRSRFSRFLTRLIIVPIYCVTSFSDAIFEHLYRDQRENLKKSDFHPVLFDSINNVVIAKLACQNETLLIYPYLEKLFAHGEARARLINVAANHRGCANRENI